MASPEQPVHAANGIPPEWRGNQFGRRASLDLGRALRPAAPTSSMIDIDGLGEEITVSVSTVPLRSSKVMLAVGKSRTLIVEGNLQPARACRPKLQKTKSRFAEAELMLF